MLGITVPGNDRHGATEEPAFSTRGQRLSMRRTIHTINKLNRVLTPGMPRALIGPDAEGATRTARRLKGERLCERFVR